MKMILKKKHLVAGILTCLLLIVSALGFVFFSQARMAYASSANDHPGLTVFFIDKAFDRVKAAVIDICV